MKNFDAELDSRLRKLSDRHERWRVWADFCEASAIALSNAFRRDERREERFKQISSGYSAEEWVLVVEMLGLTVQALEANQDADVLGSAFMRNELASHWHGQFFTPSEVSRMMAEMVVGDGCADTIQKRGYVLAAEPACGSGGMVVALAAALRRRGVNPQRQLCVSATDLVSVCVHMATVQLSLLGIPAVVWHGDTLSNEMRECWRTPMYVLGGWDARLRRDSERDETEPPPENVPTIVRVVHDDVAPAEQLRLWF